LEPRRGVVLVHGLWLHGLAMKLLARRLSRERLGRVVLGRSIMQWLGRAPPALVAGCEVGVMAGTGGVGMGLIVARGLPKPNDGVVSLHETELPGMRDRIVLPLSHSGMLLSARAAGQACAFLARGSFDRDAGASALN
jgi:hypothetical protein